MTENAVLLRVQCDLMHSTCCMYLVCSSIVNCVVVMLLMFVVSSVVDQLDIATADIGLSHQVTTGTVPADAPWPRKLEAAQNVIFCKEVFAQVNNHVLEVFILLSLVTFICNTIFCCLLCVFLDLYIN